jgi:hypothetical protein
LSGQSRGATIVEFALIAPVLLVTADGHLRPVGYNIYTSQCCRGPMQEAARSIDDRGRGTRRPRST